jgi:hypothetical protein
MPSSLSNLWAGRLPATMAFWHYMIFWGFLINVGCTFASLAVLVAAGGTPQGWSAGLSLTLHLLPIPYNLACLVGVWRSTGRAEIPLERRLAMRSAAIFWTGVMLLA